MKKYLIIGFALFILAACKKPIIDYRSKYVGTYAVTQYSTSYQMGQVMGYDTLNYEVEVNRADNRYSVVLISPSGETEYILEKDGTLHFESMDSHYHENGGFTDKNHFHITGGYHGLGGSYSFERFGIKK